MRSRSVGNTRGRVRARLARAEEAVRAREAARSRDGGCPRWMDPEEWASRQRGGRLLELWCERGRGADPGQVEGLTDEELRLMEGYWEAITAPAGNAGPGEGEQEGWPDSEAVEAAGLPSVEAVRGYVASLRDRPPQDAPLPEPPQPDSAPEPAEAPPAEHYIPPAWR
jgi:hypothetical protein